MIKVGKWIAKHKILIIIIGIALLIPSYLGAIESSLCNCACCKHRFNTFLAIVSGRTDFLNPSTADCWNHFVYICGSFSACNSSGRIQCFFKSVENAWKFRNAWKR